MLASAARHGDQLVDDGGQLADPAVADHQRHEAHGGRLGLAAEEVDDDLLAGGHGDVGVGELVTQLVVPLHHLGDPEQLVLDLGEGAFGPSDREECLGVGRGAVVGHQLFAPTWLM